MPQQPQEDPGDTFMRKALMFAALAIAGLALPASGQAADCTGKSAHYTMPGADGFELTLELRPEPLAWSDLDVVLKTPARKYRYSLTASNGYSYNYMAQEEPPLDPDATESGDAGSFRMYPFDDKLTPLDLPQSAKPAPAYIFVPDLCGALWYGIEPREFLPIDMWRLKDCG